MDSILSPQDYKIELVAKEGENLAPKWDNHGGSDFHRISSYQQKGEKIILTETNSFLWQNIPW